MIDEGAKGYHRDGQPDDAVIGEILRRILAVTRPDRIILFGSAATGRMNRDSDVDLLVVEREVADARRDIIPDFRCHDGTETLEMRRTS